MKTVLFVDDDMSLQREIVEDINLFVPGLDIVLASHLQGGIEAYRQRIGSLHAGILDFRLNVAGTVTSIPLYAEMLRHEPEFVQQRVIVFSNDREGVIHEAFDKAHVQRPSNILGKGSLQKLVEFLRSLPDRV